MQTLAIALALLGAVTCELRLVFERQIPELAPVAPQKPRKTTNQGQKERLKPQIEPILRSDFDLWWEKVPEELEESLLWQDANAATKACNEQIHEIHWTLESRKTGNSTVLRTVSVMKSSIQKNPFHLLTLHVDLRENFDYKNRVFREQTELHWLAFAKSMTQRDKGGMNGLYFNNNLNEAITFSPENFCEVNSEFSNGSEMSFMCFPEVTFGTLVSPSASAVPPQADQIIDLNFLGIFPGCSNTRVEIPLRPFDFFRNSLNGFSKEKDISKAFYALNRHFMKDQRYLSSKIETIFEQFLLCAFQKAEFLRETQNEGVYSRLEFHVDVLQESFKLCQKEEARK